MKIKDNLENKNSFGNCRWWPACMQNLYNASNKVDQCQQTFNMVSVHTYMISRTTERMKLAGVWGIPSASFKSFRRSEKQFQAIKVLIFKPDHCCRKIKSPLRFLQTTCVPTTLNWGSGEQQAQNNSALFSIMQSMKDLKTSVVSRLLVFLSTNSICGLLQWR